MEKEARLNKIIDLVVKSDDADEIKHAYRDWVDSYDQDLEFFGYVAPQIGVELFHQALGNPKGLILDAGCGTGLCGKALAAQGYQQIHGADFSPDMLAKAQKTKHYEKLLEADFRQPLDLADQTYDGIVSIGVYKPFIGEKFLKELIRIVKPGGILSMSCRLDYFENDLELQIQAQEKAQALSIQSITTQPYMKGQGADAVYVVLEKK